MYCRENNLEKCSGRKEGVLRDWKVLGPNPKCMADERQKLYSKTCIKLCVKIVQYIYIKTQWKGILRALHKMLFKFCWAS
jgi:hypothetical protein